MAILYYILYYILGRLVWWLSGVCVHLMNKIFSSVLVFTNTEESTGLFSC